MTTVEEDYICSLKEVSPRIDLQIRRIQTPDAAVFFHKRLQQLASAAREKVQSLETGKEIVATSIN